MRILAALTVFIILSISAVKSIANESRIVIAVIDSGANPLVLDNKYLCASYLHKSFTNSPALNDTNGHGTNIAGIVSNGIDSSKYCLAIIKYTNGDDSYLNMDYTIEAFKYAYHIHAKHINYSSSGEGSFEEERNVLRKFLNSNGSVAVAAGNNSLLLTKRNCPIFPACYDFKSSRYYVVGANDLFYSNYGTEVVNITMPGSRLGIPSMSGTSQATALFTNKMLLEKKI